MLNFINQIGKTKLVIISTVSVALFASLLFFIINFQHLDMSPLYKDISLADRSAILNALNTLGVNYEVDEGEILIDGDRIREVRMMLAAEGLPSSGSIVGYEIFNKSEALGTSSFSQNVNLLRALEGELSRTIASFDNIQTARVHLAIPKKELFSREVNKPKASVIIKTYNKNTLGNKQMSAITHLIASAVQGLDINNITIVSTDGQPFRLPSDQQESLISSSLQEYKLATEQKLKNSIESLIGKFVGIDKVKAEVNVELDLEHFTVDAEVFDPDGQVMRSLQNNEEDSNSADNIGAVSVANNIPNGTASENESRSKSTAKKREEVINYEISREVIKKIKEVGDIRKLSVAVLIDGNYTKDEITGEYSYTPHSTNTLQKLHTLVASAVGFDADRGDKLEIINMQFFNSDNSSSSMIKEESWWEENLYNIIKLIMILMTVLLVVLLVKSLLNKWLDNKKSVQQENVIEQETVTCNEVVEIEESITMIKKVEALIAGNVEHGVSMLKEWTKE